MTKEQIEAMDKAVEELSGLSDEEFFKRLQEHEGSDLHHIIQEMRPASIFPEEVQMSDSNKDLAKREREAYEATVQLADASSPQEAIDYLKKVIAQPLIYDTKTIINEAEINKINLKEGDVLLLKVKGPDFENDEVCKSLQQSFKSIFPNNKIGVLFLEDNSIDISVISQEQATRIQTYSEFCNALTPEQRDKAEALFNSVKDSTCNSPSYCADCNCGKKANAELPKEEKND